MANESFWLGLKARGASAADANIRSTLGPPSGSSLRVASFRGAMAAQLLNEVSAWRPDFDMSDYLRTRGD